MGRGVDWAVQDVAQLPVARGRPETTRDACIAARLVAGEHQDEDQAVASRCAKRVPFAEAAANE